MSFYSDTLVESHVGVTDMKYCITFALLFEFISCFSVAANNENMMGDTVAQGFDPVGHG